MADLKREITECIIKFMIKKGKSHSNLSING